MRRTRFTKNSIVMFCVEYSMEYGRQVVRHLFLGNMTLAQVAAREDFYWRDNELYSAYDEEPTGLTKEAYESNVGRIDDIRNKRRYYTMPLSQIRRGSKEWQLLWNYDSQDGEEAMMALVPRLELESLTELADYYNGKYGEYSQEIFYKIIDRERYRVLSNGDIMDRGGNVLTLQKNEHLAWSTDRLYVAKVL